MEQEIRSSIKSFVLENDLDKDWKRARRKHNLEDDPSDYLALMDELGPEVCKVIYGMEQGLWRKRNKVREKVGEIVLSGQAIFLTLTFKDSVLASTSAETRRRYVARFLKKHCLKYAANIDFGDPIKHTGREHYHAIVWAEKIPHKPWAKYGNIDFKRIRNQDLDLTRTSKYIVKLSRHAMKETCGKTNRLIYSRG